MQRIPFLLTLAAALEKANATVNTGHVLRPGRIHCLQPGRLLHAVSIVKDMHPDYFLVTQFDMSPATFALLLMLRVTSVRVSDITFYHAYLMGRAVNNCSQSWLSLLQLYLSIYL